MKILFLDTSSFFVSIAIVENSNILYKYNGIIKDDMSSKIMPLIREGFNSIDFDIKDIDKIIYDFLSEVVQKTFKIGIEVVFEESVREFILNKCDAENYGARGIKRTIQKYVENKIAKLIIDGDIAAPCRIIMSSDMKDILCKSEVSIEK